MICSLLLLLHKWLIESDESLLTTLFKEYHGQECACNAIDREDD